MTGLASFSAGPVVNNFKPLLFSLHTGNCFRKTLPEFSNLPSVFMFAKCISSGTQQTSSLPSADLKTLGKKKHSVNKGFA